jgi:hypothetical protein
MVENLTDPEFSTFMTIPDWIEGQYWKKPEQLTAGTGNRFAARWQN